MGVTPVDRAQNVNAYLAGLKVAKANQPFLDNARSVARQVTDPSSPGGDRITRGERLWLASALRHVIPSDTAERRRFDSLRSELSGPDDGRGIIQVHRDRVTRESTPPSDFLKGEPRDRLIADATARRGSPLPPESIDRILTDEQRRRDIPVSVTRDGKPLEGTPPLRWDPALPRGTATTVPGGADENTYQLPSQASVDGKARLGVQANPLYDRLRDSVQHAFPGARIDSPSDLLPYVRGVTATGLDGYPMQFTGDQLRALIERGAILRTDQPTAGSRFAGDGAHEISPVIAVRGSVPGFVNIWGIDNLRFDLQTPRRH